MSYQTFPDSPETAEILSNIPHRRQDRPSTLSCFIRITAIFLVLFLIALCAALIVDKTVPKLLNAQISTLIDTKRGGGLEERVLQLERQWFELQTKENLEEWIELEEEDKDKED